MTSEAPYVCPECGREFGSPEALNSHMGKAHPREGVGEEEEEEEKALKPPEVARREKIIDLLERRLPSVYWVSNDRAFPRALASQLALLP